MTPAEQKLISLFLPDGILEYFELTKVGKESNELQVFLEEKTTLPEGYKKGELESKGLLPEISIQDFPIRGNKVALRIKRRRWKIKSTGEIITRDWDLIRKGTRMTTEFGLFLKGIFG